jgi:hypothetical protein
MRSALECGRFSSRKEAPGTYWTARQVGFSAGIDATDIFIALNSSGLRIEDFRT